MAPRHTLLYLRHFCSRRHVYVGLYIESRLRRQLAPPDSAGRSRLSSLSHSSGRSGNMAIHLWTGRRDGLARLRLASFAEDTLGGKCHINPGYSMGGLAFADVLLPRYLYPNGNHGLPDASLIPA